MNMLFDWPEVIALLFLISGFFLALFSANIYILYLVCFLMGLIFGRWWWKWQSRNRVPTFLAFAGFLLGFIAGSLFANLRLIILIAFAGIFVGYYVHKNNLLNV